MSGRYSVEDLLKLRASPLISKPASLPPVEEWMGPVDTTNRRPATRGKPDDSLAPTEGFQKRPSLLDGASRRTTNDPDRMTFGPPKHSFSSSNIPKTKLAQADRTRVPAEESDNKAVDRKSGTFGGVNGKFEKSNKRLDEDEPRPRRENGGLRWNNKDNERGEENGRGAAGRAKFEQPWGRRDRANESIDDTRDGQAWRRSRGKDLEFIDGDPEWVDAAPEPEPAKHSHEEFLQWMASMKNKTTSDSKTTAQIDPDLVKLGAHPVESQPPALSQPMDSSSMDKFFAKFNEGQSNTGDVRAAARPTKSRFASMFAPKEEPKVEDLPPPPISTASPHASTPSDLPKKDDVADKVAFNKLLEMLGKNNAQQHASAAPELKSKSPADSLEQYAAPTTQPPPSDLFAILKGPPPRQDPPSSHTPNPSLDRLIESRSPAHHANRSDAKATPEDLLSLLRRSNIDERRDQPQYPQHQQEQRPPPGLSNVRQQETQLPFFNERPREGPRSIFDDPVFNGTARRPDAPHEASRAQHSTSGSARPLFADMNNESYRYSMQQQQQSQLRQSHQPPPPPPGLQRPPGLDGPPRQPPGWPMPQQQQSQPQSQVPQQRQPQPPPGIPNVPRNMPPYANQQQQLPYASDPRQMPPPQRKRTMDANVPPGYTGASSLPPGFGPPSSVFGYASPTSPDSAIPQQRFGVERQPQYSQQQGNVFAAMYGNVNRSSAGGVGAPPGFR